MKRSLTILLTLIVALTMVAPGSAKMITVGDTSVPANSTGKAAASGNYIVQLAEAPVIEYTGGIGRLRSTATNGQKIDPNNIDVKTYAAYLDSRHTSVINSVGGQKFYDYHYTLNGFAAKLSAAQAEQLRQNPGVISVDVDEVRYVDTVTTPAFLGLSGEGGLWDMLGGVNIAGRNIVIGDIDSGIWPENPSFAWNDNLGVRPMARWNGKCQLGEDWTTADLCNGKIIGAAYFNAGQGGNAGIDANNPWEFNSARDYNGHGTHTASTAGGDNGVTASLPDGTVLGKTSGMAPNARIAVYKALWSTQDGSTASGTTSDLVAAIDQAVADGVDVINYSISGPTNTNVSPDELAFLRAARAGIFVSASAGNSGPTASTVAHNDPWLTTVAAGTHDRLYKATVTLGNGAVYTGISVGSGTPELPLVLSTDAALAGADPTAARLCYSSVFWGEPVLDPAKVAGKIVVCDRGNNARVDKSLAVKEAGGLGMVLANTAPNTLNADIHAVPTVHVDEVAGAAIKAYVTADPAAAKATLSPGVATRDVVAPDVASFSSRGPALVASGNLLKPDIMAPGVDVLAAVSPASSGGLNFNFYSGTSMAAPHITGIAALFKQAHPDWSPMMIKSALMTTASQTRNDGSPIPVGVFGYGAGQVQPKSAYDPGLVYDSNVRDWIGYLCGTNQVTSKVCPVVTMTPSNFNSPSIAISALAGSETVTRRVTSVGTAAETYTLSVKGLPGITVAATPSTFTIQPRQTVSFQVAFTRTDAALNAYVQGFLVWTGSLGHVVQIPVAIRPVALAAPLEVFGNGANISYSVKFGYDGSFTAAPRGLVPAVTFNSTIATGETLSFDVVVPAGTTYARFATFNANTTAPDLDLEVYRGSTLVGSSGGSTADEQVNLRNPTAATYTVHVIGFDTGGAPANFTLFAWALGSTDAGNMAVSAPSTAVLGQSATITLSFNGLAVGTKYLGSIAYTGTTNMPNPTIVSVDVPAAGASSSGQRSRPLLMDYGENLVFLPVIR